jgi:hypothetical protein
MMKYFTPQLLDKFRSKDDKVADQASERWEKEAQAYTEYLQGVHSQLPAPLLQLFGNYYLHDAEVVFAGRKERDYFVTVKLDAPPGDFLWLQYELVAEPIILQHHAGPVTHVPVQWLYDEIEILHDGTRFFIFPQTHFRHSILLTNGSELQISFRDFRFFHLPTRQVLVSGAANSGVPQMA